MKKVFLAMLALCVFLITNQKLNAQTPAIKVGLFDIEMMVRALPDYRTVDSLTNQYEQDSLGAEYQEYMSEFQRLDSTYKADSAAKRPQSVLDYSKNLRQQMGFNLAYWNQIAQQKSDNFRGKLAQPLYAKVVAAYKKVISAKKYNIILKPSSVEYGFPMENIFPLVAKEMNVTIDPGLMVDPNTILDQTGGTDTTPQQKTGTGKP
jgi:Skp family chaperone for outer membrane proteins